MIENDEEKNMIEKPFKMTFYIKCWKN